MTFFSYYTILFYSIRSYEFRYCICFWSVFVSNEVRVKLKPYYKRTKRVYFYGLLSFRTNDCCA